MSLSKALNALYFWQAVWQSIYLYFPSHLLRFIRVLFWISESNKNTKRDSKTIYSFAAAGNTPLIDSPKHTLKVTLDSETTHTIDLGKIQPLTDQLSEGLSPPPLILSSNVMLLKLYKTFFSFFCIGQYTAWLLLPSFVGLLVFLYGVATIKSPDNRDAWVIVLFWLLYIKLSITRTKFLILWSDGLVI